MLSRPTDRLELFSSLFNCSLVTFCALGYCRSFALGMVNLRTSKHSGMARYRDGAEVSRR